MSENDNKSWKQIRSYLVSHSSKPKRGISLSENLVNSLARFIWIRDRERLLKGNLALSIGAQNAVRGSLVRRLSVSVERLVDYQWQVFLCTPFLKTSPASTKRDRDLQRSFFSRGVEHRLLVMTDNYPELARILLVQISYWRGFFVRFKRDANWFVRRMRWNPSLQITRLVPDISDHHRGAATVIYVRFSNGKDWYYKPRPGIHTAVWFEALSRINKIGFSHLFKIPRLIPASTHHWMEAVKERPCADEREVKEFFFQMGAFLYLLDVLQGVDFHAGNLVCHGAQPVFVDCETLMHPETPMPGDLPDREQGLFRVGILPRPEFVGESVAALGPITLAQLLPCCQSFSTETISSAVVRGFLAMHEFFAENENRQCFLKNMAARLGSSLCRAIYRPTVTYRQILYRSLSPKLMSDTGNRLAFLRRACTTSLLPRRISEREVVALKNLDIPLFTVRSSAHWEIPSDSKVWSKSHQIADTLAQVERLIPRATCLLRARINGSRSSSGK